MRVSALAAILGLTVAAVAAPAVAEPWTDPAGRLVFEMPRGWNEAEEVRQTANFTAVSIFDPNHDCSILAQPNQGTRSLSPTRVREAVARDDQFDEEFLENAITSFPSLLNGAEPEVVSHSLDTSGDWPIFRVEYAAGAKTIHGALQLRPGLDITSACAIYDGADSASDYDAFFRSIGTPRDAEWEAQAATAAAEPAEAAPTEE